MNDRPPEPVQEMMSDEDFTMIIQDMARSPGYREEYARRKVMLNELHESLLSSKNVVPEPEPELPEPVQEMISDEDLAMIVQEMIKTPGYYEGRARRIAAINRYRNFLLSLGPIPTNLASIIRDEEDED